MKKTFATILVSALTLGLLAGCGEPAASDNSGGDSADKGSYTITIAHSTAENTAMHNTWLAFKDYVEDKTDGAITVNIYPNGQMGGDREVVEAVQNNEITITDTANAVQANFVADAFVLDVPFAFPTLEAMRYTLADPTFVDVIGKSYDAANLHLLGYADTYFRVLSANKPVYEPADLKGMTIRTMENEYHMEAWRELGANPTPLAFNELYTALQQGTVDAQENPLELIYSQKFFEQQDYVILTNHLGQIIPCVMSKTYYDSLPEDYQKIIDEGWEVGLERCYEFLEENEAVVEQAIRDSGTEIIELTPEQLSKFQEATAGVGDMIQKAVSAEVYEALQASCASFDAQ